MEALSVLSLKDNKLLTKEAGKTLAQALASNSTLKELDVSSNTWKDSWQEWKGDGSGFAQELTVGLKDNGALSKFDISKNALAAAGAKALATALEVNQVITELNIASNELWRNDRAMDMSGINALSDAISDMGALIKLDISSNRIGREEEEDLQRICVAGGIELAK
jgi:Ran GTPase-activating protein (RanGAP) involved in mRNA processing and transport